MPPVNGVISARSTIIAISPTAAGTYTTISYVDQFDDTLGSQNEDNLYFYGSATPLVDTTAAEQAININFLLNLGDTAGQVALRSAARIGTPIWVRLLYDGANGVQRQVTVSNLRFGGDANGTGRGKYVTGSCTLTGSGPVTDVVAP